MKRIAVSATSWTVDRLDVFGLGPNNALLHKWSPDGNSWGPSQMDWESLGGIVGSAPVAVSWGPHRLDLFGLDTKNQMQHKWWDGNSWGPSTLDWESLGGAFISQPVAISWGPHRLDVFGMGTDSAIWHKWWDGSSWKPSLTGWESLGGVGAFQGQPTAVTWGPNRLDVFAVIHIGEVYHKFWTPGQGWQPTQTNWESLGGNVISPIAAVAPAPNDIQLYAVGAQNHDMLTKGFNGTWQPSQTDWISLGGVFDSPPAVASWSPLDVHIFGLGTDDQMYHRSAFGLHSTSWEALGGVFLSAPAALSWGANRLDIFGLGTDDRMYHKYWIPSINWGPSQTDWELLGRVQVFDLPRVGA